MRKLHTYSGEAFCGDRYVSEIDIPVSALKSVPGITEPQPRAIVERRPG